MVERFLICQLRHAPENSALHRQAAQNPVRLQHFQRPLWARAGSDKLVEELPLVFAPEAGDFRELLSQVMGFGHTEGGGFLEAVSSYGSQVDRGGHSA